MKSSIENEGRKKDYMRKRRIKFTTKRTTARGKDERNFIKILLSIIRAKEKRNEQILTRRKDKVLKTKILLKV